jgi:hypothetical protein
VRATLYLCILSGMRVVPPRMAYKMYHPVGGNAHLPLIKPPRLLIFQVVCACYGRRGPFELADALAPAVLLVQFDGSVARVDIMTRRRHHLGKRQRAILESNPPLPPALPVSPPLPPRVRLSLFFFSLRRASITCARVSVHPHFNPSTVCPVLTPRDGARSGRQIRRSRRRP